MYTLSIIIVLRHWLMTNFALTKYRAIIREMYEGIFQTRFLRYKKRNSVIIYSLSFGIRVAASQLPRERRFSLFFLVLAVYYDIFEAHKLLTEIVIHSENACANCGHTRASKFIASACETFICRLSREEGTRQAQPSNVLFSHAHSRWGVIKLS